MSEILPEHQLEYQAFLNFVEFAKREPLFAPNSDALAHVIRRLDRIVVPATECMARLRPEYASFDWTINDDEGYEADSGCVTGPEAYTSWKSRHTLSPEARDGAVLIVGASDESVTTSILVPSAGPENNRFETARRTGGQLRDLDFRVTEKRILVATSVNLKPSVIELGQINLDVLEGKVLKVRRITEAPPLVSRAEDIADPGAAQAFEQSGHWGLAHHQLWRCARDICGVLEAGRMVAEFPKDMLEQLPPK